MNSKELCAIREWAPLTVIDSIPAKMQRGFFLPTDVNITCVDSVSEFLALGSDAGVVFWYNRHTGVVQKLKAEIATRITCVKIVNSVEYMVAAGHSSGQVSVFQIQKELPPDLNLVAPCTRSKPIERYTIRDLHRSTVSCCEWSKNGMKLYSGDRQGVVVLTEFDYQTHLSKSSEILSEAYEIVQLSVYQSYLLVSTLYRSIVCQRSNTTPGQWNITQVGKKDRKQLIDCGGTFLKRADSKQALLICGRPGLRFWLADTDGNVEKTLLFREAVTRSPTWEIPILNPKSCGNLRSPPAASIVQSDSTSQNFSNLHLYGSDSEDSLVVTHDESSLYILNLDRLRVEAVARGFRKILDFCVCDKEIFVLEGERSLLRLAPMPEKPNKTAKIIFNPLMPPPVPLLGTTNSGTFESPVEYEPEEESVISAEECFELPPIEVINLNIPIELAVESPRGEQNRRIEIFNQISDMDFDQSILHHSGISINERKKRKSQEHQGTSRKSSPGGIVEIGQAATSNVDLPSRSLSKKKGNTADKKPKSQSKQFTTKPTLMDASYCVEATTSRLEPSTMKEAFSQHLPDLLSPTTLKKTIEAKAKTLAEELNLPQICLARITDEELRQSQVQAMAPSPLTATSQRSPSSTAAQQQANSVMQLSQAYPQQTQVEDAEVQTTPRKKVYYLEDECDYSTGQSVDEICHSLNAISLVENLEPMAIETKLTFAPPAPCALQFVPSQPVSEEIDSFLLDFRRAGDPMRKSPPPSAESNTSSEWEFLDN